MRIDCVCAAGVAALVFAGAARADVVTITADRDNTLYFSTDPLAQKSNGAGPSFYAGNNSSMFQRRGLVHFDLASAVPAGSTINSVTFTLTLDQTLSSTQTVKVHRVLADWGEGTSNAGTPGGQGTTPTAGDATWLYRFFNSASWGTPGGDFVPAASATASHTGDVGPKSWSGAGLAQDVTDWLADPSSNFGWIVIGDETDVTTARRYDSREAAIASVRPMIVVDFTPCKADFDHTGFVDTDDFDAFIHAFEAGDESADFDGTGFVDTDDFDAFVHAFEAGC